MLICRSETFLHACSFQFTFIFLQMFFPFQWWLRDNSGKICRARVHLIYFTNTIATRVELKGGICESLRQSRKMWTKEVFIWEKPYERGQEYFFFAFSNVSFVAQIKLWRNAGMFAMCLVSWTFRWIMKKKVENFSIRNLVDRISDLLRLTNDVKNLTHDRVRSSLTIESHQKCVWLVSFTSAVCSGRTPKCFSINCRKL